MRSNLLSTLYWSLMLVVTAAAVQVYGQTEVPAWWYQRGVLSTNPANDYAALNVGQLKNIAYAAWQEMNASLTNGAGFAPTFTNADNNYAAVTVGQLKEVARPFYTRLDLDGYAPLLPSTANNDFALANIGQAKQLFRFVPSLDADGDSILNQIEFTCGTDPFSADTDGDGLSDGDEVSFVIAMSGDASWFDISGGTVLLSNSDDGCTNVPLPFTVSISDRLLSRLSANANGLIGLFPGTGGLGNGWLDNSQMAYMRVPNDCGLIVAGFWDDLCAYPALSSAVTLADVTTNGNRYCVIEYKNMGFYSGGASSNNTISFQIVFEEGIPNRFRVFYKDVHGYGDGRFATLGARTSVQFLQFAYNAASVSDGLALAYYFAIGTDPLDSDTDNDGLDDGDEIAVGTDPFNWDTDGDDLSDGEEVELDTDPLDPDTDDDGLEDGWEIRNIPEFDPLDPSDGRSDYDGDNLTFAEEYCGTHGYTSDPNDWDTDGDGLSDGEEATLGTGPRLCDTDGDGLSDSEEISLGTDPLDNDTDNDNMKDGWEVDHGFRPLDASDGVTDADGDGLSNVDEAYWGTDPNNPDTDGDGLSDGAEVHGAPYSNPRAIDTDGDGLDDAAESLLGTDPRRGDTDSDNMKDGWEVMHGFNPLDSNDPDPAADPDGDHIANLREAALGTDPHVADTDGDGLSDGAEVGWIGTGILPFAVTGGISILPLLEDFDWGTTTLPLPFPVKIHGIVCSNVYIEIDGRVELGSTDSYGYFLEKALTLNAFSDNLKAYPSELGSSITMADITTNGNRYCVIEYKRMGFKFSDVITNDFVSFQIIFQENIVNRADVAFTAVAGYGDGRNALLNARLSHTLLVYSEAQPIARQGLSIAYHLGTGTNPLRADTDGDGFDDAADIAAGLNPLKSDTDGDGLSDAFEAAHVSGGMDPLIPAEPGTGNSAGNDPDGDGRTNEQEETDGTDPSDPDTDGDGVNDGDEISQGSDPLDPADSQPRKVVPFTILFGDESGSHSEKYRLTVTPIPTPGGEAEPLDPRPPFTLTNREFGQPDPFIVRLVAGASYEVMLEHVATDPKLDEPDYDYTLSFSYDGSVSGLAVISDDPDEILGIHDESSYFYAAGKFATLTVVRAGLIPDFDRDRKISPAEPRSGIFSLWINDDNDVNDVATDDSDIPALSSSQLEKANCSDEHVNGRADLLDLFPVWLDIGEALSVIDAMPGGMGRLKIKLRHNGDALSFVTTGLTTNNAGAYLVQDVPDLAGAGTRKITSEGTEIYPSLINVWRADPAKGIILVEGRKFTMYPLILEIWRDGKKVLETSLPLCVAPVQQMFVRANGLNGPFYEEDSYFKPPDNGKNVIFLHGFNVTPEEARAWHAEMFKRLWQSGSNARYHGVTWRGDIGWANALHYHDDVVSAFETAPYLASYVNGLSGTKVVMAHSLGNMVVSSAIADHGMGVSKFFMFNAAIPAEAFDSGLWNDSPEASNVMVHYLWRNYTKICWSTKFHECFSGNASDDRRKLTWKNRFGSVPSSILYNYYSSGDQVLELFSGTPDSFEGMEFWDPLTLGRYGWHKQEMHKGRFTKLAVDGTSWAGWEFEYEHTIQINNISSTWTPQVSGPGFLCYTVYNNFTRREAMLLTELGEHPVFRRNPSEMFTNSIPDVTQNEILARGIPALSPVTGNTGIPTITAERNIDMDAAERPNGWGRNDDDFGNDWLHGDLKNMAFFYNFKVFEDIVLKGVLK